MLNQAETIKNDFLWVYKRNVFFFFATITKRVLGLKNTFLTVENYIILIDLLSTHRKIPKANFFFFFANKST